MASTTSMDFKAAHGSPERVLNDPALRKDAKRTLLAQWRRDLTQLQTATEENMPALTRATPARHERDGETADLLQRVSNCLLALDAD